MAKLLYVFVKNIGRKIINQGINFSDSHMISFENSQLKIEEKNINNGGNNFWGGRVDNCSLLVGKNGVGKTSILDLVGFNEKTKELHFKRGKYFFIYQLDINKSFYFSGTMSNEIDNFINIQKGVKNFSFKKNQRYFEPIIKSNSKVKPINTYYLRSEAKLAWTKKTKIYKGNTNKVLKYFYPSAEFKDILSLVSNFNFIENLNRSIRIEQKLNYINNPRYLAFLYQGKINELNPDSKNFLFFKENVHSKNIELSRLYNRRTQDRLFDKNDFYKEYFIMRFLEKVTVKHLSFIWNSELLNENEKYSIFEDVLKIREETDYFMLNPDSLSLDGNNYYEINHISRVMKEKTNYLLMVLNYFYKNKNKVIHLKFHFEDSYNLFMNIPNSFYADKNSIMIPGKELEFYNEVSYLNDAYSSLVKLTFENFSEGELVFLDLFAKVATVITHSKGEDLILILDEPDINLHPEWSRQLVNNLIHFINENKQEGRVQIIISTHSPFIVTDFPKNNIFTFIKNEKGNYTITNPEFGFAANIYDLISDTFFMESPIGEFAINKIKEAKKDISLPESKKILNEIDDQFLRNLILKGSGLND